MMSNETQVVTDSMSRNHFGDRLAEQVRQVGTPCVVGLDPSIKLMPASFKKSRNISDLSTASECAAALWDYNRLVLEAVRDVVGIVKPQAAYYERYGSAGMAVLENTLSLARDYGLLAILDAKRADIGSTSEAYAEAYLSNTSTAMQFDCMTIVPYLGGDSIEPFVRIAVGAGNGLFVCAKTSNPGAADFQDLQIGGRSLYERVAEVVQHWARQHVGRSGYSSIGVVAGATFPEDVKALRRLLPHSFFLVPGIGAQGGSMDTLKNFFVADGLGAVVNSSRAIMYPGGDLTSDDLVRAAVRAAAVQFVNQVNQAIK